MAGNRPLHDGDVDLHLEALGAARSDAGHHLDDPVRHLDDPDHHPDPPDLPVHHLGAVHRRRHPDEDHLDEDRRNHPPDAAHQCAVRHNPVHRCAVALCADHLAAGARDAPMH